MKRSPHLTISTPDHLLVEVGQLLPAQRPPGVEGDVPQEQGLAVYRQGPAFWLVQILNLRGGVKDKDKSCVRM